MIKDKNIAWKTERVFIPVNQMSGFLESTGTLTSLGAGTPVFGELTAAAQLAQVFINAAGNEIFHFWPIPRDFDRSRPFRVRLHFAHLSTDADAPVWKTFYKAIARQEALSAANSTPDETITHAAHTVSIVASSYEVTVWALSASNTKITADDIALLLAFECDSLGSASANEIGFIGAEIEYTKQATTSIREIADVMAAASV